VTLDEVHARRKHAGENLLAAWGLAIIPNLVDAFGVNLPDEWWWYVVRYGLSAVWLAALVVWLRWLWQEWRAKHEADAASA
jgi:hypothetical protein